MQIIEESKEEYLLFKEIRPTHNSTVNRISDLRSFLTSPVSNGIKIECIIRRQKSGLGMYPVYYMRFLHGGQFLMASKKRPGNKSSNYMITMDEDHFSIKSSNYLSKLRSNFVGTTYHLYDSGANPKKRHSEEVRQELCVVSYESKILKKKGPR